MKTLEEQFYDYAVVPVVVLDDAEDAAPLAEALVKGGTSLCRGDLPHRGGRRVYSYYERKISGNAGWRRNCSDHRAGGPGSGSRRKIYCKPRL